jgi:hypothetical protein
MAASWRPLRLLVAAAATGGTAAVGALYAAVGTRLHEQGRSVDDALLAEALEEAGLPADLLAAATTRRTTSRCAPATPRRRSASAPSAAARSSPSTRAAPGSARSSHPSRPARPATDLWQGLVSLSRVAQFSELKRGRAPLHG